MKELKEVIDSHQILSAAVGALVNLKGARGRKELADFMLVTPGYVTNLLNNQEKWNVRRMDEAARFFNMDAWELLKIGTDRMRDKSSFLYEYEMSAYPPYSEERMARLAERAAEPILGRLVMFLDVSDMRRNWPELVEKYLSKKMKDREFFDEVKRRVNEDLATPSGINRDESKKV